jgi:UDP-glucose 4-epimerase
MICFITGGAGFIGSHLAARLLSDDSVEKVVVYDNLSSGSLAHLNYVFKNPKFEFIKGDIKNENLLYDSMLGCDTVFHLAANPDISKASTMPEVDFWEGSYLTLNVLQAMKKCNAKRIIFTSGSGVYGDKAGFFFDESYGPCFPVSPYGAAKASSESLISAYCHMFNIRGLSFRFANVVGPSQTHGVGFDFIRKLKADGSQLLILGDGKQSKSYIHITDILDAMFMVMSKQEDHIKYDVFNVSTDDYISVNEIARLSCDVLGLNFKNISITYTGGDRGWNGDVPNIRFNTDKIKSIGWSCQYSSAVAMEMALRSISTNNFGPAL